MINLLCSNFSKLTLRKGWKVTSAMISILFIHIALQDFRQLFTRVCRISLQSLLRCDLQRNERIRTANLQSSKFHNEIHKLVSKQSLLLAPRRRCSQSKNRLRKTVLICAFKCLKFELHQFILYSTMKFGIGTFVWKVNWPYNWNRLKFKR